MGEHNLTVAVAISKDSLEKPMEGQLWRGEEIKRIRGLYSRIRRALSRKKLMKEMKRIGKKERVKVDHQLNIVTNEVVEYLKYFEKPVIIMEDLNGMRENFKNTKS